MDETVASKNCCCVHIVVNNMRNLEGSRKCAPTDVSIGSRTLLCSIIPSVQSWSAKHQSAPAMCSFCHCRCSLPDTKVEISGSDLEPLEIASNSFSSFRVNVLAAMEAMLLLCFIFWIIRRNLLCNPNFLSISVNFEPEGLGD